MDLHDGAIQSLYAVALGLAAHERALLPAAAPTCEPLRQARAQINAVIQDIRNYIFDLRPQDLTRRGLRAGLEALAEELRINALVRPELTVDAAADDALDPDAAASLLHVAREATANVIRHASATAVQIVLERRNGRLVLAVHDNGRGFDSPNGQRDAAPPPSARSGHGLRNMAERARALGGTLQITSAPGAGTVVCLDVPLAAPRGDVCNPAP
jgi:signal transduction histidine kinase